MSYKLMSYRTLTAVARRTLPRVLLSVVCLTWPLLAAAESSTPAPALPPTATPRAVTVPPEPRANEGVVNINTASAEELERLPGVGPTRARAILELRTRNKSFTRLEELMRVKGIGRATFRKLRPYLTLTGPTTRSATH